MPIILQPEVEAKLRARADAAGISVETYIERIAHDDQTAEEELEALALEGLASGESTRADEKYWTEKRQGLIDRHRKPGSR